MSHSDLFRPTGADRAAGGLLRDAWRPAWRDVGPDTGRRAVVRRFAAGVLVCVLAVLSAVSAHASEGSGDYTVVAKSGLFEDPPANATAFAFPEDRDSTQVELPFRFPYWGVHYDSIWVAPYGYIQIGVAHGHSVSGASRISFVDGGSDRDGTCAPHCANFHYETASWWTDGTAPNRRVVVSWADCCYDEASGEDRDFQVQLFEGSGKIVFAYRPESFPSTWIDSDFTNGLVAPGPDPRWVAPDVDARQSGHPGSDYEFTPRKVSFTGRVLYDRIVPGASGIPSAPVTDVPVAGALVELRLTFISANGEISGSAMADADGGFGFTTLAAHTALLPEVHVVAKSAGGEVRSPSGTEPLSFRVAYGLDFVSNTDLGTRRIGATADPSAAFRAPLAIAQTLGRAHDRVAPFVATTIPPVTVHWSATDTAATSYDASTGTLRVAGPASSNPDSWDDPVIVRTWGRHVLAALSAPTADTPDDRFDAVTTAENAFAVAFGHHVEALVSGGDTFVDGTGASTATVLRLEAPSYSSVPGPACAASVTQALYDLLDAANEAPDEVDGTADPGRVLTVAGTMTSAPTSNAFLDAWVATGHDAAAITRVYIGAGLLADDSFEPNDRASEAAPLGSVGVIRRGLALNRSQEDWFSVTVPAGAPALIAEVKDDASTAGVGVAVEIRSASGTLLATGAFRPATGTVRALTGAVTAGTYHCVVRHVTGDPYPSYTFQALVPVELDAAPIRDWTVGRPYDFPVEVRHGIPPYTLGTVPASPPPPGIVLRSDSLRAIGTPLEIGDFAVGVQASDSGSPVNVATRSLTVRIHDALRFALPGFVCFPAGRAVDTTLPTTGGTLPFTFAVTSGTLPPGLAFDPGTVRVTGMPQEPASTDVEIDGTDVAGSSDHAAVRAVVTLPAGRGRTPAPLAAGPASCGWWIDAVEGSTISVAVSTEKKQPKRRLTGVLLGPDRAVVAGGAVKTKPGAWTASKLVCPSSGRYHLVVSAQDGGAATSLLAAITVSPAKKAKAAVPDFGPDDTTTLHIGALPGATLVLKFSGDRKSALVARLHQVRTPGGEIAPHATMVKSSARGGTLTMRLDEGGTWTVVLGGGSTTGAAGKLSWSYSLRAPKGAAYVAE